MRPQITLDDALESGKALTNTGNKATATFTGEWLEGQDVRQGRGFLVM